MALQWWRMKASTPRGTRERILRAAEQLLGDHGYRGTRLHEIARRVGVQKASLFHYFAGKEDLYRAVMAEGFGDADQVIRRALAGTDPPFEKIRRLAEACVDLVRRHPARTKILLRQSLGDAPAGPWARETQRLLRQVIEFITAGQEAGLLADTDAPALVFGVVGMLAFLVTSAPALAPGYFTDTASAARVARVKRHVVEVLERCLAPGAGVQATVQAAIPARHATG
jgi:AcrR family transcriptional regulator